MANAKISALNEVTGANLDDEDVLAIVNATETKKVKFNELISTAGLNKLSGTPIPSGKVAFASGAIVEASMAANSVNTAAVKDSNITADKLANSSTTVFATSAPTANFTGQNWVDTDDSHKLYSWDGSAWQGVAAGTTAITGSASQTIPSLNVTASTSGGTVTLTSAIPNTASAKHFIAGPTGAGGAVSARAIVGTDLPIATSSALGAVKINAGGLAINSTTGVVSVNNSVTANGTHGVVTHDAFGLITGSRAIASADLPAATTSAKGSVIVPSSGGLSVDGSGNISITNSATAGTYGKVTIDAKGLVTAGAALVAGDIPNLAATIITSGTLDAARIADDSIGSAKLSNSSTCIVQSIAQSGYPTAAFTGQLLFDSVAEDAYLWDGNAWQAITTLTKGSLVNGGTFNASTSKMASVTTAGSAAGLVVGSNLPTASATTDGVYVVVSTAGTPSSPAPVVALNPPDYVLGVTNASGSSWNEIDLSATVSGQIAANVGFTPYGQLSSTNCQDVIQEIETEKLGKAGGEVTGELLIGAAGSLVFEGSTANAYETTIAVTDPSSADRTATFPDASGTVVLAGNAQIVNADISTSAAIALSKLANVTSAQIIVGNGSNVPTAVAMSGDATIANNGAVTVAAGSTSAAGKLQLEDSAASTSTTKAATPAAVKVAKDAADAAATTANAALPKAGGTATGTINLDNDQELRLFEADSNGSAYIGIKGATDKGSDASYTLSLPAAAPTAGQVLKANSSTPTTLEWGADSGLTLIDEDDFASNSATQPPSQQSTKAYIAATSQPLDADLTALAGCQSGAAAALALLTSTEVAVLDGVTSTTAELNILDGVTSTTAELNILDGVTATTTELNYVDGVTSAIQTQLDAKAALAGATFTGDLTLNAQKDLRFADSDSSNYVAFQAPATVGSNVTWTLPATDGSSGQHLATDGSGALSWATDSTTDSSKMPLAGGTFTGHVNFSNGKNARFYENTGNGSNYIALRAPAAVTSDVVFYLPPADGSADHVLKTDGSGNWTFGAPAAAGATGGGTDEIFVENERTVTTSYSITATKNAHSVGPIALNSGVVVTVPAASTWMVS